MMFEYAEESERLANIKVAGVGGAGGNAVGRMIEAGLTGVEFLAINTDLQVLKDSQAHQTIQIGAQLTKGLGSGGDPARGQAAAEESRDQLAAALDGADMVFVTAGMGGGTGTGASPQVAEIARKQGALTVGIVTTPFLFEGKVRNAQARTGIERLRESVDTLIVIPNQRLLQVVPASTSMEEAFRIADNILYEATRGIYEIISRHDHVNLDFADVRTVMKGMGEAMMGTGRAEGENRGLEAAKAAISSPLLDDIDIHGSQAVLVNVLGREVGLQDTAAAMEYIQEAAGPQAHVIFGYGTDETMGDALQVTVIATGFKGADQGAGTYAPAAVPAAAEPEFQATPEPEPEPAPEPEPVSEPVSEPESVSASQASAPAPEAPTPAVPAGAHEAASVASPEIFVPESPAVAPPGATVEAAGEPEPEIPAMDDPAAPEPEPLAWVARAGAASPQTVDAPPSEPAGESSPFLRTVGRRSIGEVEVPDPGPARVQPQGRPGAGLGKAAPGDDLNAPAYTRKYMD